MTTRQRWILVLAALAAFMTALDTLVVTHRAQHRSARDLGASVAELEWTVNAYNLSFAVLLMTAAALGDRFGRRRLFAAGSRCSSLASAACALAPSVGALIAARAVQGAGAAAVTTLALTLVGTAFPPERRGAALGIFFAVNGLAVAGGPLVGGAVTEGLAWPWIFWLNVPIGVALVPLVLARDPREPRAGLGARPPRPRARERRRARRRVGARARQRRRLGERRGARRARRRALALVGAFVAWQLRAPAPMLPMRFFRSRAFSAGNAAIFCCRRRAVLRACSSWPSSCRPGSATGRSAPGCGCCRGRRRCSSSRPSPASSSTASASGRSSSSGRCCRPRAWAGSR